MIPAPHTPDCRVCCGFFVTHDAQAPYGCRMFAMKTRVLPMIEVERTSGRPCQAFEPRPARAVERDRPR